MNCRAWLDQTLLAAAALAFSPTALLANEPKPAPSKAAEDKLADGEFTIGPTYTNAPELVVKDGVPGGVVTQFVMNSEDSKIYPGIAKRQPGVVPYKRKVSPLLPKATTSR
jgi:iron(III)-enterobactin esterase